MNAASRRLAAALWLLVGASFHAAAQGSSDPMIGSLPNWDFNHDGVFTCENWKRYMAQLFARADRRKRGYIDAAEFEIIKAADPMFFQAEFSYFDPKGTGRITKADFVDWPSPFFIRYDTRHTCRITRADLNVPEAPAAPSAHRRGRAGRGA
jgi:hypothetical protein